MRAFAVHYSTETHHLNAQLLRQSSRYQQGLLNNSCQDTSDLRALVLQCYFNAYRPSGTIDASSCTCRQCKCTLTQRLALQVALAKRAFFRNIINRLTSILRNRL